MALLVFRKVGGLVMRTFFAAEPRTFDWQPGFKTQTYTAQPFPPVAWGQVPSGTPPVVTWCDALHLTWITKDAADANSH